MDAREAEGRGMMADQIKIPVARWESVGGKYWVELCHYPAFRFADGTVKPAATYTGPGCMGSLGIISEPDAIAEMQQRVDTGQFQADANKTPMRRLTRVFRTSDGYTLYRSGNQWVDSPQELQVDLAFGQDESGHPTEISGERLDGVFGWVRADSK